MGMPAQKIEPEVFMEERVARLEANVEHIQADVFEMKVDLRGMRNEIKELALTTEQSFADVRVGRMKDRAWWLLNSGMWLGVMARAFGWI